MLRDYYIHLTYWLDPFFLLYFGTINVVYCILLILGAIKLYLRRKELSIEDTTRNLRSNSLPEIAFLIPCYNESENIIPLIDNLISLVYRYKEIIIINDGSTDNTFDLIKEKLELLPIPYYYKDPMPTKPIKGIYKSKLHPEIIVIDKENGSKFDALNAALNVCSQPYFITTDADVRIDDAGFEALVRPILANPETIAIGASVRIRNGCTLDFNRIGTDRFPENYVTAMQSIEYLRAFIMRQGWDYVGGNYVLSGAFSVFVTDVLRRARGFAPTFANDLEIILRLNRLMKSTRTKYQIKYLPDPVAWTEGPQTLKLLGAQREVWQRGVFESIWFNKVLFFNPKYGRYGLFVFPFLIFGEALEPLVETLGYIYIIIGLWLGVISGFYIFLFLTVTLGFTFIFTIFCLCLEELGFKKYPTPRSLILLFLYSAIENIGYRQMTIWWRLKGFWDFLKRFGQVRKDSQKLNESMDQVIKQGKFEW